MVQDIGSGSSGSDPAPAPSEHKPPAANGTLPSKPHHAPAHPLSEVSRQLNDKINAFLADQTKDPMLQRVQAQVRVAIEVVEEAYRRFRPEQISLSYNGGKDCLVLTIIHPFQEVDDFVASTSAEYHLQVSSYHAPMREALTIYQAENPKIEAIFVGTRRTDPFAEKLQHFDPTDAGWPSFMRVHPVIDWHLVEIWTFIRHLNIPYCELYDQGYTSLGGRLNTHPNPLLKKEGEAGFRPAYELVDDNVERLGRDR
uniref:FAD synthase n=1 Tax=Bionectria ochroleuca TaxID=29856 RepID=A0A0B7JYS8_BIOOC